MLALPTSDLFDFDTGTYRPYDTTTVGDVLEGKALARDLQPTSGRVVALCDPALLLE